MSFLKFYCWFTTLCVVTALAVIAVGSPKVAILLAPFTIWYMLPIVKELSR